MTEACGEDVDDDHRDDHDDHDDEIPDPREYPVHSHSAEKLVRAVEERGDYPVKEGGVLATDDGRGGGHSRSSLLTVLAKMERALVATNPASAEELEDMLRIRHIIENDR